MASKRSFLTADIENETVDAPMATERPLEEPKVVEEKIQKNDSSKDRFGPTPAPTGEKFLRKKGKVGKTTDHIRLQKHLLHTRKRDRKAAQRAEIVGILDPADQGTIDVVNKKIYTQSDIVKHADVQTLNKNFALDLDMGPYTVKYDPSGRHLLMAGQLGHIAMIDHLTKRPLCEFSTNEIITVSTLQSTH